MRVRDQFKPDEGIVLSERRLAAFGSLKRSSVLILNVAIGGNEKPAGAGRRVLDDFAGLRLHQPNDAVDQGRGVKYCPAPDFFSAAFFSSKPFVEIAKPFFARGKPIELVDAHR